ncbi:hypothetical protein GCM10009738_18690 [Kitasatospora viridis]
MLDPNARQLFDPGQQGEFESPVGGGPPDRVLDQPMVRQLRFVQRKFIFPLTPEQSAQFGSAGGSSVGERRSQHLGEE